MSNYDTGARDQDECTLSNLIRGWNDTFRAYPSAVTLHQLCEDQVQRAPEAIAITFEGNSLSFSELSSQSNQLAHLLRRHGVGKNVLVGVSMERSLELVVALLGVLKAGGAYVALDPDYPPDRLAQIIADAEMPVILTQQTVLNRHADLLANHSEALASCATLCLDTDGPDLFATEPKTVPDDDGVTPSNLAYVIYTSGTTGMPKGVMNTHRGICNRLLWMQDEYQIGCHDSVLQKTPTSFDVSVWEFFWPLITGSRLVLARPGGQVDSNYLCQLIDHEQITVMHFVPSMLRVFLQEPRLDRCKSLKHVICSGEELSVDLRDRFFERLPANLHNLYGPTEAAIDVTSWACRRGEVRQTIPIGRPVANTQIHILDPQLQPVPISESGELHIGGVQVARGYLNRPELTFEKFIDDPFCDDSAAKLYKTGDLARFLPDGNIEFLGRADHQVKIRGQRIELKEIELVAQLHSDVQGAVVLAHEFGPDDLRLVAYILTDQPRPAHEPMIDDLRRWIQDKLPEYMTPSVFVFVDQMPLTPSGKLDRKALPPPTRSRPPQNQPYVAPRTPLETRLARMWRELLQLDEIGVDDPFFELGGDSLRAAEFVNRLQQQLHQSIYVVTLFQSPSVARYAEFLERDYAAAVDSWLGRNHLESPKLPAVSDVESNHRRVDQTMLQRMQFLVPSVADLPAVATSTDKNPSAIFILAPPRSGTTLLRIMLAGHPKLFAAAELQLLGFHTLQQRKEAFSGRFSAWLDGTIRAIMQLKQCEANEAKDLMTSLEQQDCSTKDAYRLLQQWAGTQKLVDKSPSYALDPATLRKAECDFENVFYIHLIRHPYAMVRSFERQHMEQILYLAEHDFTGLELGELVWTLSHRNILDFLQDIPQQRQIRISFEQLIQHPQHVMTELCDALDLEFHPSLLNPYEDQNEKMVDGIYDQSTPMGDTNFFKHERINPEVAKQSENVQTDDFLGEVTWTVARALGYSRPEHGTTDAAEQWQTRRASARVRRLQKSQQRNRRSRRSDN